jgi:Ca-activated chloride channel family protein
VIPVSACLISGGLVALQAVQDLTFRSSTDIVPLYATVRGPDGRLATDLTRDEFQLFDNGRPVPIEVFSRELQPLSMAVLVDVSGGFIQPAAYANLRTSTLALIDALGSNDRMRLGTFAFREIGMAAELTGDKAVLRRVVAEELWPGAGARPLWNAVGQGISAVRSEPGKRVVLVLTAGPNSFSLPGQSNFREVREAAGADDVMVYTVFLAARRLGVHAGNSADENSLEAIDRLTTETGGGQFAAPGGQRLTTALGSVADELRQQYAIGFTPAVFDGRPHKIELRVTRAKHTARARTQFIARRRSP